MQPEGARRLDLSGLLQPPAWDRVAEGYASYVLEAFGAFSADALRLAGVGDNDDVIDIAAGPGTLALQAARAAGTVTALDFSAGMLAQLRSRADDAQLARLTLVQGDGQALPFADASFDAGFSMFGLFMFPDRARGFAELRRVLRPGGRAVVATWQPQEAVPAFTILHREMARYAGGHHEPPQHLHPDGEGDPVATKSPPKKGPPLSDPDELRAEMEAAGFRVEVHPSVHGWTSPSLDELWSGLERSHVGLAAARDQLSASDYETLRRRIRDALAAELGKGSRRRWCPPGSPSAGSELSYRRRPDSSQ